MSTAPHRARILGTRHMAAAGHYLAAQAALQILENGGNAIDAGVAGGIALGVVQCEYVGFGGVAPIMLRLAETGEVHTITGLGPWPRLAQVETLRREHAGRIPAGLLRTVVPAATDAWVTALERWGTMSYGEVAAAALRFAREGFPAPSLMCEIIAKLESGYRRWPENERIFLPAGRAPSTGERFVQSDLAQTIRLLDGMAPCAQPHNSAEYIHLLVEAFKLAFSDRHHYIGDPDFVDVPIERMLSEDYLQTRRAMLNPERADPGMPMPGDRARLGMTRPAHGPAHATAPGDELSQIDTSYVSVIDDQGNLFSATPSDGSASSPVIPGLGFVPSSRGVQSWTDPEVPAVLAPGKRPRLTPNPAIAIKADRFMLSFGSPGNDVQCQAMLQVLNNVFEFGMILQTAIDQPRFASFSYPRSSDPHPYSPGLLNIESRIDKATGERLAALGHEVRWWPDWDWAAGAVCAVMRDGETGTLEGAADPRRPGAAAGW